MKQDIENILQKDPAARSKLEVLLCYPGLHALWIHRAAHALWNAKAFLAGRLLSHIGRTLTGIEIHPGARIGNRVFFDHGMGIVIGETAIIGDDCTIYQGAALGGLSLEKGKKRHPTLENHVMVGSGAKILGDITIGSHTKIGANAVVTKSLPPNVTAVGIPAKILEKPTEKTKP